MAIRTVGEIINTGFAMGASDIHIRVDRPPTYRINDRLLSRPEDNCLSAKETREFGEQMLTDPRIRQMLEDDGQVDFAQSYPGQGRVRANLFIQDGQWAAAIRIIAGTVPDLKELGLPGIVKKNDPT